MATHDYLSPNGTVEGARYAIPNFTIIGFFVLNAWKMLKAYPQTASILECLPTSQPCGKVKSFKKKPGVPLAHIKKSSSRGDLGLIPFL